VGKLTKMDLHLEVTRLQQELSRRDGRILELVDLHNERDDGLCVALRDVLAMLDASSFGGHKTYRCLTAFERARLEEIRKLVTP
jgi:hypothetical protein